jgi:transposase
MERVIERCCGLDVHKKTVAACVRVRGEQHVRTFGTTTRADGAPVRCGLTLLTLADWLLAEGVSHVAMESTGGGSGNPCSISWRASARSSW